MKNRFHRLKEIFSSKIKPKMKNKKVFWGSIAGCAGLAIIFAGGFFLQAKGASKNQTETTVQSAEAKTGTISTTVEGTRKCIQRSCHRCGGSDWNQSQRSSGRERGYRRRRLGAGDTG